MPIDAEGPLPTVGGGAVFGQGGMGYLRKQAE